MVRCCVRQSLQPVQLPGERKVTPRQASIQERQCVQSPRPTPGRSNPSKQLSRSDPLSTSTSRKTTVLFRTLDAAGSRPRDPGYSTGLPDSLQRAATQQADSSLYLHFSRSGGVVMQASNKSGSIRLRFHQQQLLSTKRKKEMEADPQSQRSKSLHQTPDFKMEDIRCVKDLLNRGDYMCKLDLNNHSVSSKVPQVCMARDSLPVQCPPILTGYSPTGIHEANETT